MLQCSQHAPKYWEMIRWCHHWSVQRQQTTRKWEVDGGGTCAPDHSAMFQFSDSHDKQEFSSVKNSIYPLRNAHTRSTSPLRIFPNVAFQTVPMFAWLTMALSCPFKENHQMLPPSMPLSFMQLMMWCYWLCACRYCLKLLNSWDPLRRKRLVMVVLPVNKNISCKSIFETTLCYRF